MQFLHTQLQVANTDDQHSQLQRFIVQELTDWANKNHMFPVLQ